MFPYTYITYPLLPFCPYVRQEFSKSMYFSNISLSNINFLSSLGSNHKYFSCVSSFLSFFNVFINLLNCSHRMSANLNLQYLLRFCCNILTLFYNNLKISNLRFLTFLWIKHDLPKPLFVISNVVKSCMNFNLSIIVFCMFLSSTLIYS